ncbi:uncharacterized protein [Primulina huaijiensis]|uniref:uncharacterized protein isoform X2 n=1 Tax=Primulina huaijiensis TaxID=1492673 RepID=UPI003CC72189
MDLPPRCRRHPRYSNVPHHPRFVHHHLTPLAPPPLPPSPPRILLPPLLPPRHDGQLPFPSHFSSPPYLPILERSYLQELDPLRKPYLDRYHPPHQDNSPFRIIHDYSLRDLIIEDDIFLRGCNNSHAYDFPRTWDRELPYGATEGNSRISEMEQRRYSSCRVSVTDARDMWKDTNADARRWDNGSCELYFEREDDIRRWDCNINRGHELCLGRNIDSRRWECVISGGRELSFDRGDNRIRLDRGINDGISLQLESRQQKFLESNLGLHRFSGRLGREGSKKEFHRPRKMNRVQKKSALHRIQLGKRHRRRTRGKRILKNLSSSCLRGRDKENFECLETLAKDNQETEQSPVDLSISFKSNSIVAKANLAASSPVSKEEICLSSRNQKIRKINNMVDTGSANSSEVVMEQMLGFQSGVLCPQIELLENFNVSVNGNVTAYKAHSTEIVTEHMPGFQSGVLCPQIELLEKFNVSGNEKVTACKVNSSCHNFVENNASKDMHSHGLDNFRSGCRLGCRSKKKRRSRNKILHGTRLQLSVDGGEIGNFETSTISTYDASKLNTNSTLSRVDMSSLSCVFVNVLPEADLLPSLGSIASEKVDIGSDTNRPSFSDRKMKDTSLNNLSASLSLSVDASTECSAKDAYCASQMGTDEVTVHAGELCLANEKFCHGDGFGFKWHADSVELHVRKWGSISGLEKNLLDSKDLLTSLGAVRVVSIDEQPLQNGLVFENAFDEVPFKCPTSVQVEDITVLSRHHISNIPKVQEDKHLSEHHKSCASECENSLRKEVENVVYDMRSADINSKEFFLEPVAIPEIDGYCSSNSKDAKVSVAAAVADCSSVRLGTVTRSNFLSADHKGLVTEADISLVKTDNQSYKDGANLCNKSGCIEWDSESKIKRKRKKKARGTQMGISGSNATEPVDKSSSVDDDLANFLATYISSVKEADFPGAEDNSDVTFRLKEGPSVVPDSHLDAVEFSGDGSFSGNLKKRKVVSAKLDFSSCLVDDSIGNCLASDDLKLDQVRLRPSELNADQSKETLSAMHVSSTDGSENFSIPEMDDTLAYANNNLHLKDDLDFIRNTLSACAHTQSGDELVAPGFDTPSCISSPEDLLPHKDLRLESEMIFDGFQTSNMKPVSGHFTNFSLRNSVENATFGHLQTNTKVPPSLPPQKTDEVPSSRNKPTSAVPNIFSGHPAFNFHTSRKFPSNHFAKSRTWHRTDQSSINATGPTLRPCPLPQSHMPKTSRISQSSYVRKGNSLVRKPSSSGCTVAHTLSSSVNPTSPCMDYLKNNQVKADTPCTQRIGQVNSSESSQTMPLNHTGGSLRSASCHLVESLPVTNSLGSGGPAKTLYALKETVKSFEIPECQTGSGNNSDSLSILGKENLGKKISYVKRRSNQLIATSDPKDPSTSGLDKSLASLSDGYYKNSKNQLIRVYKGSRARKGDSMETLNLHRLGSQTILPKSSGKRQSSKGFAKTYKLSKFSLVLNLNGAQFSDKSSNSSGPFKVWPYLFPWRRATYRRSSLPTISQKLLLSSKRGAIYTRSTHGYSLRISKVLSVCGRSLKWSKSIERNSKKANEEATRAVVAAEKRKKEEKGVISFLSKSRNHVSRERIFRVGSERYKMDPSRRSLRRITEEEEPSPSDVLQSEKNLKKSYLPKRLLIGNDEYVQIGTGNQLVRDPKKRTRVLASEKVRWSLRTARLRLARKRKYCQFFTRFGKCNKSDGKCPYVHDPSKIVVCTKFLNGSCTDSDCKLTHKVIPERMPDCSYFLKGSCSNENCPYRHVNVNPQSSICKRFLRGFCAYGNECRKKHTYVCPAFESTGICPQSSMCKLHHPKKKTEKKPVIEQKIVRGRYFDGGLIDVAECSMATGEKLSAIVEDDIVCEEGEYPDYISLDISNDGPEMTVL